MAQGKGFADAAEQVARPRGRCAFGHFAATFNSRASEQARRDVDGEREDGRVECKRQQRVQQHQAPHRGRGNAYIRGLRGHGDGERHVQDVAIAWLEVVACPGELQAAAVRRRRCWSACSIIQPASTRYSQAETFQPSSARVTGPAGNGSSTATARPTSMEAARRGRARRWVTMRFTGAAPWRFARSRYAGCQRPAMFFSNWLTAASCRLRTLSRLLSLSSAAVCAATTLR